MIFLGLPLRTRKTIAVPQGGETTPLVFSQPEWSSFFLAIASISVKSAKEATSAGKPSAMERAWLPDPPCD